MEEDNQSRNEEGAEEEVAVEGTPEVGQPEERVSPQQENTVASGMCSVSECCLHVQMKMKGSPRQL